MTSSPPLTNGHDLKVSSLDPEPTTDSFTTGNLNGHDQNYGVAPQIANGVETSFPKDTQSTVDPGSSFPASGETGESLLPTSSQSVPDESAELSAMKIDHPVIDPAPAIVQQPTSDLREETQPANAERTAEIKEQKQQEDMVGEDATELTNGLLFDAPKNVETLAVPATPEASAESTPEPVLSTSHATASEPAPEPQDPGDPMDITTSATTENPAEVATEEFPNHPPVPVPEGATVEAPLEPAPSPAAASEIPAPPATAATTEISAPATISQDIFNDQMMQDVPPSPAKVGREREDDDMEDGPDAKRTKTDDEAVPDHGIQSARAPIYRYRRQRYTDRCTSGLSSLSGRSGLDVSYDKATTKASPQNSWECQAYRRS